MDRNCYSLNRSEFMDALAGRLAAQYFLRAFHLQADGDACVFNGRHKTALRALRKSENEFQQTAKYLTQRHHGQEQRQRGNQAGNCHRDKIARFQRQYPHLSDDLESVT
jgi:hypothetical protein